MAWPHETIVEGDWSSRKGDLSGLVEGVETFNHLAARNTEVVEGGGILRRRGFVEVVCLDTLCCEVDVESIQIYQVEKAISAVYIWTNDLQLLA